MVNTREIAAEYRLGHWAQKMRERSESGLSIKAYCRENEICANTYYYWQRKLREAACEVAVGEAKSSSVRSVVPSGWAKCESAAPAKSNALTIEIGAYRVSAYADTDPELLKSVCRTLASIC